MPARKPPPNALHRSLLLALGNELRARKYSVHTERQYCSWVRRFLEHFDISSATSITPCHAVGFLKHLAVDRNVSPSTHTQARAALEAFFERVLGRPLDKKTLDLTPVKRPKRLPIIAARADIEALLAQLDGDRRIAVALLYGSGLRVSECTRLRVKDVDFERREITVRDGKGRKDRVTMLPESLVKPLRAHLEERHRTHQAELKRGLGHAALPDALDRKLPNASQQWAWQWIFPSEKLNVDAVTGRRVRFHCSRSTIEKALGHAVARAGVSARITCHALRHTFATHLLQSGYDIRTIQELMGHADVATTMIYTHVLNRGGLGVLSPLDAPGPVRRLR